METMIIQEETTNRRSSKIRFLPTIETLNQLKDYHHSAQNGVKE